MLLQIVKIWILGLFYFDNVEEMMSKKKIILETSNHSREFP